MADSQPQTESKVHELCQRLRTWAYEKGPGYQFPPVRILCEELKTTRVTLHEALNILESERILDRRKRQGIFVSQKIAHKEFLILFDSSYFSSTTVSPFWSLLLVRLEQEAQRRATFKDETSTIHMVRPEPHVENSLPEKIRTILQTERINGVLAIGLHTKTQPELGSGAIPSVTFAGNGVYMLQLDGEELGRQAALALIRQGAQRLGFWAHRLGHYTVLPQELEAIAMPQWNLEFHSEWRIFRDTILEQQLSFYPELSRQPVQPPFQRPLSLQEQGYLLAYEVFGPNSQVRPDGIFVANDMMMDGTLVAFEEMGIRVGQDIKVVTTVNAGSPLLFGRTQHMAVLEFDPALIAQELFAMLDALITGHTPTEDVVWMRPRLRQ